MKSFAARALKPLLALLVLIVSLGSVFPLQAQDKPLWLRYPAISPDGQSILFCYKGDIYQVSTSGGQALPLTISESCDFSPVWSHDGKSIAFASDRFGNFDAFIMPASGGEATRLTYHSADDIPSSFTADDQRILFSSTRQDLVTNVQFPMSEFPELYSVSVKGGEAALVLTQPAISATVNPAGDKIIFTPQVGLVSSDGKGKVINLTKSGFASYDPRWGMDGTLTYFGSTKEGAADLAGNTVTLEIYSRKGV